MATKLDLYITFHCEPRQQRRQGRRAQSALVLFGRSTPTKSQQHTLQAQFGALKSCAQVHYYAEGNRLGIGAVGYGQPGEKDFVAEVLACAREHYNVRQTTRP